MTNLEMSFGDLDPVMIMQLVREYGLELIHLDGVYDSIQVEGDDASVDAFEDRINALL